MNPIRTTLTFLMELVTLQFPTGARYISDLMGQLDDVLSANCFLWPRDVMKIRHPI
jgi:hypothetical protein